MSKKVLIIERGHWQDELRGMFEKMGWQIVGVTDNREEALRLFQAQRPDLVTFATMPQKVTIAACAYPGLGIAEAIRKMDASVPIFPITGFPDFQFEGQPGLDKKKGTEGLEKELTALLHSLFTEDATTGEA